MYRTVLVLLASFMISCSSDDVNINDLEQINVNVSTAEDLVLSDFIESITYSPLSAPVEYYLFNDWLDVRIKGDNVVIQQDADVYDNYFVFTKEGEYKTHVTAVGEGIGSIVNGSSFIMADGKLKILDSYQQKIVVFDAENGKYADEKRLPYPFSKFIETENGYVFYMRNQTDAKDAIGNYNLVSTDKAFNVTGTDFVIPDYLKNYRIKEHNFSSEYNGVYLFHNFLCDTIFEINSTGISPRYEVDFGSEWVNKETLERLSADNSRGNRRQLLYDRSDHVYTIYNVNQDDKTLFFTFAYDQKMYWVLYNKATQQVRSIRRKTNDLDLSPIGRVEFWPLAFKDDELYFLLPYEELQFSYKQWLSDADEDEKAKRRADKSFVSYEKMITSLPEAATAVLAKAKLR